MKGSFAIAGIVGVCMGIVVGGLTQSFIVFLITAGATALVCGVLALLTKAQATIWVYPGKGVPEVYIGRAGIYQPGRFTSLARLADVQYETTDPAVIAFYNGSQVYTSYSFKPATVKTTPVRVGVPRGHEDEAQQLVERFKAALSSTK